MSDVSEFSNRLRSKQAARYLNIPEGTLRYWRNAGIGPPWLKFEGSIRYDVADLDDYIQGARRIPSVRTTVEAKSVHL